VEMYEISLVSTPQKQLPRQDHQYDDPTYQWTKC
jgi:hypothetical protein